MTIKAALITGGNKGIGLAVCKGLADKGFRVFLGSRDERRGMNASTALVNAGYKNIEWIKLDVTSPGSIANATRELESKVELLNVLVNNAGVYLDQSFTCTTVASNIVLDTFTTNALGPLLVTRALSPLLSNAKGAEVINISSGMGQLNDMGGGSAAYRISKTALNAVSRIFAAELAEKNIRVNSVCPGWVKTDMGGSGAPRSTEQGADTVVWLATGGANNASGYFYRDRNIIAW